MKYKFWDVSRDRKKMPIPHSDRLLELVALAMVIMMLVLTGILYSKAPDTVPSHFNLAMEADAWSGKSVYWVLAGIMLVGMVICASAAYNRKLVNLPVRLKEPVFYHQIGLISRMCRVMTIVFSLVWLAVLYQLLSPLQQTLPPQVLHMFQKTYFDPFHMQMQLPLHHLHPQ